MKYSWGSGVDRATRVTRWLSIPMPCLIGWGVLSPFHAIPFAWFNRGELVRTRFDSVFYRAAASVCFPAKCRSQPSLALPAARKAIMHSCGPGYIPEKVLVVSFTMVFWKSAESGRCRLFTSLATTLKGSFEWRKRDPRGLVGLPDSFSIRALSLSVIVIMFSEILATYYSQTKRSVPLKITLMNSLFEY